MKKKLQSCEKKWIKDLTMTIKITDCIKDTGCNTYILEFVIKIPSLFWSLFISKLIMSSWVSKLIRVYRHLSREEKKRSSGQLLPEDEEDSNIDREMENLIFLDQEDELEVL